MKQPRLRLRLRSGIAFLLAAIAAPFGCSPSNSVPAGAPILQKFSVVSPSGAPVELETEAGSVTVPPLSHFVAVFDRLLDATLLSDLVDGSAPTAKADTVRVAWSGGTVESSTLYTPGGHPTIGLVFPLGPSLTTTPTLGLPSGSDVMVILDPAKVRSHDQKTAFTPADGGTAMLAFTTDPLSVVIDVPPVELPDGGAGDDAGAGAGVAPPVPPTFVVNVSFNNQTTPQTGAQIRTSATVGGVPVIGVGAVVEQAADNPANWTVSPPATGWPAGAVVTVSVGGSAADLFAITLGTPASATFTVTP